MPDAGYFCIVTATNAAGATSAQSNDLLLIPGKPNNIVLPDVSGSTQVDQTLNCTPGLWIGDAPITYAYQWKRAPATNIGTTANYTLVAGDAAFSIRCTVTATNAVGSTSIDSDTVGPVTITPVNTIPPDASGAASVGFAVSCTTGVWNASPSPVFTYQWKRDGAAIPLAVENIYVLTTDDVTKMILCTVTATNLGGVASIDSDALGPVIMGAGWTPAALPGLLGWYDGTTELYSDVAGTVPIVNGVRVEWWKDRSGLNHHVRPSSVGNGPIYNTTGFNGHPALMIDGLTFQTLLKTSSGAFVRGVGDKMSAFVVAKATHAIAGNLVAFHGLDDPTDYDFIGSAKVLYRGWGTLEDAISAIRVGVKATSSMALNTSYRFGSIFDGLAHRIYVNNVSSVPVNVSGNFKATGTLGVAGLPGLGDVWDGPISEVVITNTALTATERKQLDDYFIAKWGPF